MGIGVAPGTDQPLAWTSEAGQQTGNGVGVTVVPAAYRVDGAFDRAIVLRHRPLLPIGVAGLVFHPGLDPGPVSFQPRQPHRPPPLAHDLGIGRQRAPGEAIGGPGGILVEQAAAHEVNIVGVAVVGRTEGDDRLQRRRPVGSHLQRIESAPRNARHADGATAPGLGRRPGDDLLPVLLLAREIFVRQQTLGITAAPDIHPDTGIAARGDIGVYSDIAGDRTVALAIGDELEDRRHGIAGRILGQPDLGRKPHAVGHGNIGVLDQPHAAQRFRHDVNLAGNRRTVQFHGPAPLCGITDHSGELWWGPPT